jgi:hypothetical protein
MTSSSGLRGHRRTYLTILESADHALGNGKVCPSATSEAGVRGHSKITTESEKGNLRVWLLKSALYVGIKMHFKIKLSILSKTLSERLKVYYFTENMYSIIKS